MAIANYNDLKEHVALWLERDDLNNVIPEFITMCEQRCNNILRHPSMEETATLTLSSNSAALPADYLEAIAVYSDVNTKTPLDYVTPDWANTNFPSGASNCAPYYTLYDGNLINYLSGTTDVELIYYEKIPALTSSNTTNWLLTRSPNAYLYGACLEAAPYLMDDERAQVFGTFFSSTIGELNKQGNMHRYSRGNMRLIGATP